MTLYQNLSHKKLVDLLSARGMKFKNKKRAEETLQYISYYKIKEFAEPFLKINEQTNEPADTSYKNISFEQVLSRYYQDKNFRLYILHAIEDIEVALAAQIASVIGDTTDEYGYLAFSNWTDIANNSKNLIEKKQEDIKKEIRFQVYARRSSDRDLDEKLTYGLNSDYPPVWKAITMLTFGSLVQMLEIMSRKRITVISNYFNCSNDELVSWMKCLNLIRNISAHNSNVIDLKIKTPPLARPEWENYLYEYKANVTTDRMALPILILRYLMLQINPRYQFENINNALQNLIGDDLATANYFGFKSVQSVHQLFPAPKSRKQRHKFKRKNKRK